MTYAKASELFESAKNKETGKPIANNTRIVKSGDDYAVRLHSTNVVTFHPDGAIVLNTGGWKTHTTKDRINEYAPVRLFSDRGVWYVCTPGQWEKRSVFQDGFTIQPNGSFTNCGRENAATEIKAAKKSAAKYAAGFIDALFAGNVPAPSNGDCWYCLMREVESGKPLGEITRDCSHIQSHIDEPYYVPSLLINALQWRGSIAMKQTAQALMMKQPEHAFTTDRQNFIAKDLEKTVRRYVLRELGHAA